MSKTNLLNALKPFEFSCENGNLPPTLPLRAQGALWHVGWDIPTNWVVDADGKLWADYAHGGSLEPQDPEFILGQMDSMADRNSLLAVLGRKPELESWEIQAIAAGWNPPTGVKVSTKPEWMLRAEALGWTPPGAKV